MTPADVQALHRALGIPAGYAAGRSLAFAAEAPFEELVALADTGGREIRLIAPAAAAWQAMRTAAAQDGAILQPLSGFRSFARQADLLRAKLLAGRSIEEILRVNAAPGYSEHHTGRALDIGTPGSPPLEEAFADTPAFAWLSRHASRFGFALSYPRDNPHGITYEPWHWCWHSHL